MPPRQMASSDTETPPVVTRSSVDTEKTKVLKNKPRASKFRQQKLPAWQPILTACTAIPVVFAIGLIFIPIGVVVLLGANSVREFEFDYGSDCKDNVNCTVHLHLKEFDGDVFFYYGLHNFFQNHRRYVKSRSDKQLLGDVSISWDSLKTDCNPYGYLNVNGTNLPIAPCGAIANSMFNDTFELRAADNTTVPFTYKEIIWEVDQKVKFKNPKVKEGETLCDAFKGTVKPPNWQKPVCELDLKDPDNNGFKNVDFIIWMRTAALPTFKKLYRKLDRDANNGKYKDGLPRGNYTLLIKNNYPVKDFNGKKSFIISTTSWVGGKNKFLGIAYIVIGCVCIILGAIFSVIHVKFGHSFAEMANIRTNTR